MASPQPADGGTLVISALLILALLFAGYWIVTYVNTDHAPWEILPWFGAGAVAILLVGLVGYIVRGRRVERP